MNIEIRENYCRVLGRKDELDWVADLLTIDIPEAKYTRIYRQGRWDGRKRYFNKVSRTFAIGFLSKVLQAGYSKHITVDDMRKFPDIELSAPELKTIELRDYQKEAVIECLKQKTGLIEAATNSGKTAIFAGVVKKLYPLKTLILIHRDEIFWQIIEMVEKYTGIKVGIIKAQEINIKPVTVAMITTIVNRIGVVDEVTDFFDDVQCIIIDEVHRAGSATYESLLSACKAPFRFGFSGTIKPYDTPAGMQTRQWLGDVILKISNSEMIEQGVSAVPKVHIYELDSKRQLDGVFNIAKEQLTVEQDDYTNGELMKRVYKLSMQMGITENTERNEKAIEIAKKHLGQSLLIIVDLIQHGQIVEKLLNEAGINAVFISGQSVVRKSALDLFKKSELKVLISTTILDEGIDVAVIQVLLFLAGKKSKRQLLQRVGRGLRKKAGENEVHIYDFLDFGSRYLVRHSKERISIYKAEGFEIDFI